MVAMVATKRNEKINIFYNRLKTNGRYTTLAQVAVMRELVIIVHSLYKSGQMYDKSRGLSR